MLELRQGSKNLLQALELLRTASEDSVAAMLQDLRSKASVSEFLQSVSSGTVATSSPVNPLAASLAEALADSKIELELNMRYPGAFPSLETLQISDVDLGLLAVHRRPGLTNQQTTMPLSPYSPSDLPSRRSGTPTSSESWSTPSDSTGDAGQRVDPRLEFLKIWQWTSVSVPDLLAAQAISFYLVNEHPVLAFFDADLMIRDLISGGGRFCSPLFVSSLLAWSCVRRPGLTSTRIFADSIRPRTHNLIQGPDCSLLSSSKRRRYAGRSCQTTTVSPHSHLQCFSF
jgi:hypothetical protein